MTESRSVSTRILRMVFGSMLVATALFAAGDHRAERAARLTLDWVDNSGGIAKFIVERKTGTAGTYVRIATTGTGIIQPHRHDRRRGHHILLPCQGLQRPGRVWLLERGLRIPAAGFTQH